MSKNTLLSELINYISANSSGNVVIAAPASGYALDVTGTGRFTDSLTTTYVSLSQVGSATAITQNARFTNSTTSTANGSGVGFDFALTNSAGSGKQTGQIASVWTDNSANSAASLEFYTRPSGAGIAKVLTLASNADVYLNNNAALFYGASALTYVAGGNTSLTLAVNGSPRLTFNSSGNAQFANNISATGYIYTNGNLGAANGNQTANAVSATLFLGNRGYFSSPDTGAATIQAKSSGGNWYSGTALSFSTNPGPDVTGTSPVERMVINSDGRIQAFVNGVNGQFQLHQTNSGYNTDAMMYLFNNRNATSSYTFAKFFSGYPDNTQDVEFLFRGDGLGLSDGGWTSPAADYAEYFESVNGQSLPIGSTVVLEDGKIRLATQSDTNIIGAIRPKNAALFLGNNAELKWNQKYLKDDFGAYILDEEGMRTLNPDYDSSIAYVSREKRNEWNIVGLVGQIPVLKDSPKNSNWVKMYDISSTVEMWLVK